MSYRVMQHPTGVQKNVKVGFSWTTMFFDFWPSIFRGEWGSAIKLFLLGPITLGIYNIFKWFSINEDYYESLLMKGFVDISNTPWSGPIKENPLKKIYNTFYANNPQIYKKLGLYKISAAIPFDGFIEQSAVAGIQTGLIFLGFIITLYKILSNIMDEFGIISPIIDTAIVVIFVLVPIFIVISFLMLIVTVNIEKGNNMQGYRQNQYNNPNAANNQEYYKYGNEGIETIQKEDYDINNIKATNERKTRIEMLEKKLQKANMLKDFETAKIIEEMLNEAKQS